MYLYVCLTGSFIANDIENVAGLHSSENYVTFAAVTGSVVFQAHGLLGPAQLTEYIFRFLSTELTAQSSALI